ncbi:MAG: hypothetical protein SVU32_03845, partial [Candidatus Nanohaloarchaea archaeon]|nr:hypothetical protein [Candidatus Nanohaloarchaea archaeon]
MKTIPLTIANLKGFVRDWQSVLLLIGVPLIIIGLIFASFSPQGIKLPIGTVDRTQDFNYQRFQQSTSSFARLIQYRNLKNCADEVYACIVITKQQDSEQYEIQVFYDNTRSIIGRRITQNVKQVADLMQLDYSRQRASTVISEVRQLTQDIRELQTQVREAQRDIDQRIIEINRQIRELRQTRREIRRQIDQMDRQVQEVEQDIEQLEQMRQTYYQDTKQRINRIQLLLSNMGNMSGQNEYYASQMQRELQEAENDLETYNSEVKQEIDDINQLITDYEQFSTQTEQYLAEINQTIRDLERTRSELRAYRRDLEGLEQQLADMEQRYSRIASMSPSEVAGFISVTNRPAYLPQGSKTKQQGTSMIVGGNLVMLQTMYSTLLLLVALFVSLLVSK